MSQPSSLVTAKRAPLLVAQHAGVYDAFGSPVSHDAHIAHIRHLMGEPLLKLAKHAARLADQPEHEIHQDLAQAASGRLHGVWRIDRYDAPIEWYVAHILGCKPEDVGEWHKLPASVQLQASAALARDQRPERSEFEEAPENLFLTAGINALWQIAEGNGSGANAGGSPAGANAAYNNTQARIAIGDSSTAASAGQTDLQAVTNKYYQVQDATFPSISTNTSTFKITVATGNANFAWNEFVIDNCGGSNSTSTTRSGGSTLDRLVSAQGTKLSTQTWVPSMTTSIA